MNIRSISAFSLIETALVLAIVGLVIGGIWVSASAVNETNKMNSMVAGIKLAAQNINARIMVQDYVASTAIPNATIIGMELLPRDWVVGTGLRDPFGTTMGLTFPSLSYPRVDINLQLPQARCRRFLTLMTQGIKADSNNGSSTPNLIRIWVDNAWIVYPFNTDGTYCLNAGNNAVNVSVTLTRLN